MHEPYREKKATGGVFSNPERQRTAFITRTVGTGKAIRYLDFISHKSNLEKFTHSFVAANQEHSSILISRQTSPRAINSLTASSGMGLASR
jgi:hypothetical protein